MQKRTKESQKRINSLILLIAFTAILLIVSTYAWFTTQKDVTLSNIKATIEAAEGLQISLDGDKWGQEFDISKVDLLTETKDVTDSTKTDGGAWSTGVNILPTELKPLSTDGVRQTITDVISAKALPFYKGELEKGALKKIEVVSEEKSGVNKADLGYIAFDIFLKDTSKKDATGKTILQLDSNSYAWALGEDFTKDAVVDEATNNIITPAKTYKTDWKTGIQNTIRVAFAMYDSTTAAAGVEGASNDITATQDQIQKWAGQASIEDVAIWEPNADRHSYQAMMSNNLASPNTFKDAMITPPSNASSATKTVLQTKYLTKAAADAGSIADISAPSNDYVIDPTGDPNFKVVQTSHRKLGSNAGVGIDPRIAGFAGDGAKDAYGVSTQVSATNPYYTHNLTNTAGNNVTIERNKVTKCRVYVWLEGQDADCFNYASYGGGIQLEIGLCKDRELSVNGHGNNDRIIQDNYEDTTLYPDAWKTDAQLDALPSGIGTVTAGS